MEPLKNSTDDTLEIESSVGPECFILDCYESILKIFRQLVVGSKFSVLGEIYLIDEILLVVIYM